MSRSTTNVFEAVQKTRNMCFIGFKTLGYASYLKSDKTLLFFLNVYLTFGTYFKETLWHLTT